MDDTPENCQTFSKGSDIPSQPGKPTAADISHNTIHLIWEHPQFGSENVDFYVVQYCKVNGAAKQWMQMQTNGAMAKLNHISIGNLAANTRYWFKVCAVCEAGHSPESEMSDPIATRPRPLPGMAGRPMATKVTHDSIELSWTCPESSTQDIKFYSVLFCRTDNPSDWWRTQKTESAKPVVVVSGLAAKAVYCFKVRAECEAGVCSDSDLSDPIATSPPPVPARPSKPRASKVTHNSIQISWSDPDSVAQDIKLYSVLYCQIGDPSSQWQTQSTLDTQGLATVSGLAAKSLYCFKVRAEGEDGICSESEMSDLIATNPHPIAIPGKPSQPIVSKVTHNSVQLNWSGPELGNHIKFYSVVYRQMDDPSSQWQTQNTQGAREVATVSGLAAKAVYGFKIRAEGEAGVFTESEMSDLIVTNPHPIGKPGQPIASKVTHNSVQLNWSGPESGNHNIKFYSVVYRRMDNPSSFWHTQSTSDVQEVATVRGLAAEAVYGFKIRAESENGVCSESEMSDLIGTNPYPIPGKPGQPMASKVTHNSVQLSWSRPESGFQDIKFYSVLYRQMDDPSSQWQTQSTKDIQGVATVSGLTANAVYCFKLHAVGEDGVYSESRMSDPIATNPRPIKTKPSQPMASNVTHNSIQISWSGPEPDIKLYSVVYRRMDDPSSQWQMQSIPGGQKVATVSGLAAKAVYCFKIRAEDEVSIYSESEMSDLIATKPHPMPGKPGQPMASKVTHNSIQLSCSDPESGIKDIKFHSVLYRRMDDPSSQWLTQNIRNIQEGVTVSGLASNAMYCFKIRAEGEAGACSESEMSDFIATKPHPLPGRPGQPMASNVTHNSIQLSWSGPESGFQDIKLYSVLYRRMDDPSSQWQTHNLQDAQQIATVSGLAAKAVYCFKIHAEGEAGVCSESDVSDFIATDPHPIPGKPGQPIVSEVSHNSIHLNWASPELRAEGIKFYTVLYRRMDDPSSQWQEQSMQDAQEAIVSGLTANAVYCFKVRAECEMGVSIESEMSDPVATRPSPISGHPEATKMNSNTDGGIIPECEAYSDILPQSPPLSQPCKTYISCDSGISFDSKVTTILTKAKVRLAERMLSSAIMIEQGPPAIYKLKLQEDIVDEGNQLKKCVIGNADHFIAAEEKVIMVLGATGAGKTTLINGVANYLLGVEWGDGFRFAVITDEEMSSDTDQACSQTKWITAYTFHHQKGSPLPYTLTIIDTPGFGDTGGLERDCHITAQIKHFFSAPPPCGIDHLNAIGFVTQASLARLTPTQKYIFDSILAIFGNDIASNIFMMATFADGGDPPVIAAIKAANIPFCDLFKFNNSSLYASCSDMFGKMFWEMGFSSFKAFLDHLMTVETKSLRLTRVVLDEREHLEAIIQGLLPQIKTIMSTMDELQQEEKFLERLQLESSDLGSKKFTYIVTTIHQRRVDLPTGEFITNCRKCNRSCHHHCKIADDAQKWRCAVMNWREAGERSVCQVCPGGCEWQKHCNNTFRIEDFEEHEERTLDELLKRFQSVKSDENVVETTVHKIQQQVSDLKRNVFEMICEAQQILARLDEIALKPTPLTVLDYIDLLIDTEKQECKPGFAKRLEYLQEARHNAELLHQTEVLVDIPQWLKESVQKAKEQMIRRRHQFPQQHSNPHLGSRPTRQEISSREQMVGHHLPLQRHHSDSYSNPLIAQLPPNTTQEVSTSEQMVGHLPLHSDAFCNPIYAQSPQMARQDASTGRQLTASIYSESKKSDFIVMNPYPMPGKPGQPMVSKVSHNSVHLNWTSPEFGAERIKFYTVLYRRMGDPSSQWQEESMQDAQEAATVGGLAANIVYCFKVRAECEMGVSIESEMSDLVATKPLPLLGRPGKPKATNVTHSTIVLNWSSPKHGAENVKCYTVFYRQANHPAEHWEVKHTTDAEQRLAVSDLAPNTRYCFKVHAESDAGISPESKVNSDIQTYPLEAPPPSQPGKPYIYKVIHDKIILKWDKPSHRAKEVKCYTVSYCMVDEHDFPDKWKTKKTKGVTESAAVPGLTPGVLYCFKVRAESDAGCSSYSESSDPIKLHAPPTPSQPGKPTASDKDIIHDSILLKWEKPMQGGNYVKHYSISYRRKYDPIDQWQTKLSVGARTNLYVSGLNPETEYCFKVLAVGDSGISEDSEVSIFHTKAKVRLAEGMLSSAIMIEQGPPAIYKLKLQEDIVDESNQLKKCVIGNTDPLILAEEKVIMVLGATGAGKTTLINGMANYLLGVQWEDKFRFKVITDEETSSDTDQACSQTKWITAYTFHHQKGSPLPYTLTIIDTPGFGDTGGLERDHRITEQIKHFFSTPPPHGIDHLNAIGFVTQASLARLTPTQKYIFDSILAIFGNDIASNIFMMATFADGGDPPVMAAIKAANIPFCDLFKFNNSSLYASCSDMFGKMFWEMGFSSFKAFLDHLMKVETKSLCLTRLVLDEREHLEAIIQGILPQIKTIMSTMDELQQEEKFLERLQLESSDLGNKEFTYIVTTIHQRRVDLPTGEFITNCRKCNRSCHHHCKIADDAQKWRCTVMNWREAGERSVCQVCPGGCEWQKHCNNTFWIEDFEEHEERTLDELLRRFEMIKSDKNAVETTVHKIQQQVRNLNRKVFEMICEAQQILARLNEIALKPTPLTVLDYIDLLIDTEKQECKPGFAKRLEYLQEARHNAELLHQTDVHVDIPQWLKESVQKAKEQMIRHRHQFQQQHSNPHPGSPPTRQEISTREQMVGHHLPLQQQQHTDSDTLTNTMSAQPPPMSRERFSTRELMVGHHLPLQQRYSDSYSNPLSAQPPPKARQEVSISEQMDRHLPLQKQHSDPHSYPPLKGRQRVPTRDNAQLVTHHFCLQQQCTDPYCNAILPQHPPKSRRRVSTGETASMITHKHHLQLQQSGPKPVKPQSVTSTSKTSTRKEQTTKNQHSSQQQYPKLYPDIKLPLFTMKSTSGR